MQQQDPVWRQKEKGGGADLPSKRLKVGSEKKERARGDIPEDVVEGGEEPLPKALKVPSKKDMRASGDDLEDDFGEVLDLQLEEEEDRRPGKKKKKKAKGRETNGAGIAGVDLENGAEKKKSKKHKVVVF